MLLFIFSLLVGIIIHEFAHFIMARSVKCKVSFFSIGFGKPIYQKRIKETIYQIGWLPFGGYVSLMHELDYSRSKYAFSNLPYLKKMRIILAGCFTNIIFGIILMMIGHDFLDANTYYIGFLNLILGLGNLFPLWPCLDGSYVWLVWLEKFYGKKKGYSIMNKLVSVGMTVINILNILCVPWLLWYFRYNLLLIFYKIQIWILVAINYYINLLIR